MRLAEIERLAQHAQTRGQTAEQEYQRAQAARRERHQETLKAAQINQLIAEEARALNALPPVDTLGLEPYGEKVREIKDRFRGKIEDLKPSAQ